jgi:hypothetical protein
MMKDKRFDPHRRQSLVALASIALAAGCARPGEDPAEVYTVRVWKSPTCGCCKDWIAHLEANGFAVTSYDDGNSDARDRLSMPVAYGSCHTAEVGGYAIEGHVPAREIYRLLEEKPEAVGLAVPAMPRGSPGMDGPAYGGVRDPYDVLLVRSNGEASVFQSYR